MPHASVVVTNLGTAERRTAETDESGNYQFVNLIPGRYRVDIEKTGFKRMTRDNIEVQVEGVVRNDAAMQVGEVGQTVEVTAHAPLLQTETTSLGQVVEARRVLEMPLNGRNVLGLVALVPGVVPQGLSSTNPTGQNIFGVGNFQIGGGFGNQSVTYIDGGPVNLFLVNLTTMLPAQDAVQEFRVQTNNIGPEYGRFAGGVINLTTKSGTNEFHGSTYEFLRNKVLNANNFFNNRTGVARPPFTQNQFGGTIGGPVVKDKTFFFFGYEGFRQRQGQSYLLSVPTDQWRNGDFSNLRSASGALIPIYDPLTTCGVLGNAPCAPGQTVLRRPFDNNLIPLSRMDKTALAMRDLFAHPNIPGQPFTNSLNFSTNASIGGDSNQINGRVDQNVSDKQHLFGRYTRWWYNNIPIDPFQNKTHPDIGLETVTSQQLVLGDTYVFSPSVVGDFRFSGVRYVYDRSPSSLGFDLTTFGQPASLNNSVVYRTFPYPVIQNIASISGTGSVILQDNLILAVTPSLTVIKGRHTMKFGGEVRRMDTNYSQSQNASGSYNFDNLFTSANPFAPAGTGSGYASFLLGFGSGGNANEPAPYATRQYYQGYYASDTFQLSRKLTINLGIRWEPTIPYTERFDRMDVFLPNAVSPAAAYTGLPLKGRLGLVNSSDHENRYNQNPHYLLFAPRTGFAYRLTDKTVLRGGYGIFYPAQYDILGGGSIGPLTQTTTNWASTLDGSLTPNAVLSNPFPNGLLAPLGRDPSYQTALLGQAIAQSVSSGYQLTANGVETRAAYIQQWNFNVQRELAGGTVIEVAYAGAKGTHLAGAIDQNQLSPQNQALGSAVLQKQVPNPFYGLVTTGILAAPTVAQGQLLRPFPQYDGVSFGESNRNSIYHSMQVRVQKRFAEGGTVSGSYTWSKLIADRETDTFWLEGGQSTSSFSVAANNYNLAAERALSSFDVAHRLVISYVLDFPFGKQKKYLSSLHGPAEKLVSGWGINGISTFQGGFPLGLSTAVNLTNSFGGLSRPNSTGQSAKLDGSAQSRLNEWFNVADFTTPAASTFGNAGRNLPDVRTDGVANYDFTVFKNTAITERFQLQFRTEVFNLFNRVQFGRPGVALGTTTFGVIGSQLNNPRLVQFALRLNY
ncbi:MAG: TonB-dependent receptor [Acidobacteriia bacterium]|nr:TonB-dependent receptor [Terriglobia bacterium]